MSKKRYMHGFLCFARIFFIMILVSLLWRSHVPNALADPGVDGTLTFPGCSTPTFVSVNTFAASQSNIYLVVLLMLGILISGGLVLVRQRIRRS